MINRNDAINALAATMFATHVDLDRRLLYRATAQKCFEATEAFTNLLLEREEKNPANTSHEGWTPYQIESLQKAQEFLKNGRKIQAIKEIRQTFGFGLKEAKDVVDKWEANKTVREWFSLPK